MDDYQRRSRSGVVEILCRKVKSFWKKKEQELEWKQCTLEISDFETLQYYRNKKNHGEVPLTEIQDVVAFRSHINLMYPFRVHFKGEGSPWTINTHSKHDRQQWMEAIMKGSTRNQWTDTQLRHPARYADERMEDHGQLSQYTPQESGPYVDACQLNIPLPPHYDPEDQPMNNPVPDVSVSSSEPSSGSHYLTLLPPDTPTDSDGQEEPKLPEVSPAIAFATEFMKNFDPVQVDLMVQILLSALNCSASRSGRTYSESHVRSHALAPSKEHQKEDVGDSSQNLLVVPYSNNEDAVSHMSDELFDGPYHRLADLYIGMKESELSSIEHEMMSHDHDDETSQARVSVSNEKSALYAPIGDLLIDQPSASNHQDNTDVHSSSSTSQQVLPRKPQLSVVPQTNGLNRQNAVRYKSSAHASRLRSSSDVAPASLPPPKLPPKTYKQNPDVAVSKLRSMLKRASSEDLLDDDKSKHPWSKASAGVEEKIPWPYDEHCVPISPLPQSAFSNVQKIGEGQFGATYSAVMMDTGLQVALKSIKRFSSRVEKDECLREITILNEMQRPSIAKLFGYINISESEGTVMIVQELLPRGNLKDFLTYNTCSMSQLVKYMLDIAMGMHYLSAKRLIHKKLAARNILLGENDQCKVADLSLGMKYYELNNIGTASSSNSSTPSNSKDDPSVKPSQPHGHSLIRWMAPECLLHEEFSTASDVWSFGVLQWEILMVPALPYQSITDKEYLDEISSGVTLTLSTPRDCPSAVAKIMNACWNNMPSQRPSFLYISSCLTHFILEMNI